MISGISVFSHYRLFLCTGLLQTREVMLEGRSASEDMYWLAHRQSLTTSFLIHFLTHQISHVRNRLLDDSKLIFFFIVWLIIFFIYWKWGEESSFLVSDPTSQKRLFGFFWCQQQNAQQHNGIPVSLFGWAHSSHAQLEVHLLPWHFRDLMAVEIFLFSITGKPGTQASFNRSCPILQRGEKKNRNSCVTALQFLSTKAY